MKLVFLHSSDVHGYIMPTDYRDEADNSQAFSLSRISTVIKNERAKYGDDNVIVTDAGDCIQGSPLAAYVHDSKDESFLKQFTAAYNQIGYDAHCLGNHDFNFGLDYLQKYISFSQAPLLNCNILDEKSGQPAFGQAYRIINKNGIKVGLLGITTQRIPYWEPKKHVEGLKFHSAFAETKRWAKVLHPQVDILAVIYHGGLEADPDSGQITEPKTGENEGYRILQEIPEVDLLLTGHQHRKLSLVKNKTAIVQPGYRGEAVGKVILEIDEVSKKIKSMSTSLIKTKNYAPDSGLTDSCSNLNKLTQKWLNRPIAHLPRPALIDDVNRGRLEGSPFINLLQRMQLYFTGADVSATAVMSETAHGFGTQVTMRDLLLNYPYSNQLCRIKVTGAQLRHIVEYSLTFLTKDEQGKVTFAPQYQNQLFNFDVFYPLNYEADISKPKGKRLTRLELNNEPIADEKQYHLAVNNYRVKGGLYPDYDDAEIETILDKDYIQLFQEYLSQNQITIDFQKNYHFK